MTIARELADIIQSNGDVVISGGLEVNGTTTTINTTTFVVEDKNIELGGNATSNSQNDGAGISILLPDASPDEFATLTYVNSSDAWSFNRDLEITGSITTTANTEIGGVLSFGNNTTDGRYDIVVGSQTTSRGMLFAPYVTFGTRFSNWDSWLGTNTRTAIGTEDDGIELATNFTGAGASGLNLGFYGLNYYTWTSGELSGLSAGDTLTLGMPKFGITGGGDLQIGGTTVIDSSRNITGASFINDGVRFIANQIQSGYSYNADDADIWINYTGYQGGTTYFRDFRVGNGKQAQLFFVDGSSGNVDVTAGDLQIGGTTVIDSSRNLTNIGTATLSSTTSTLLTLNATANNYGGISFQYGGVLKGFSGYNSGFMVFGGEAGTDTRLQAGGQYGLSISNSSRNVSIGSTSTHPEKLYVNGNIRADGAYYVNGTTVIDSSRNLTNIGTINASGMFATSGGRWGQFTGSGSATYTQGAGYCSSTEFSLEAPLTTDAVDGAHVPIYLTWRGGYTNQGGIKITDGLTEISSVLSVGSDIQIGGTTVIDSSRNITAAAITSSGHVQASTLSVNHTGALSGTQVYIKRLDENNNLMRWGEGDVNNQDTYRFRIDQDFKFIGNSGTGDNIILNSTDGSIRGTSFNVGGATVIDSSRNLTNIGTISSGAITSSGPIKLSGSGNGQEVQVVKGQAGSFTTVTIELQFLGAGSYNYEVGVSGTNGCGIQFGGGYTNGVANFSHTGNPQVGNAWTVTSPSNNLVRLVSPSGVVGTHPTAYVKARFGYTDGFDEADISITFS